MSIWVRVWVRVWVWVWSDTLDAPVLNYKSFLCVFLFRRMTVIHPYTNYVDPLEYKVHSQPLACF